MQRFQPYLLDRLIDHGPGAGDRALRPTLSLDQLKASVARDLQSLLNTRRSVELQAGPEYARVRRSVLCFGLDDFAARCLASTDDQSAICRGLERAIADHEPRLRQVQVALGRSRSSSQHLSFTISAWLLVHPMREPVNFDAVLQTGTQLYAVTPALPRPLEVAP